MSKIKDKVVKIADPIVVSQGLELIDIEYKKESSDWVLRVYIDNPQGVLSIEDCENVSYILSEKLDRDDPIKQSYTLEVSSPGIERPLKKADDFIRYKGSLVAVKTFLPIEGKKIFKGRILGLEGDLLTLEEENNNGIVNIPLNKISDAHLMVEF
jgi:ribosome maturation factor RimP